MNQLSVKIDLEEYCAGLHGQLKLDGIEVVDAKGKKLKRYKDSVKMKVFVEELNR